jgi:GWxTD domain-containing protein
MEIGSKLFFAKNALTRSRKFGKRSDAAPLRSHFYKKFFYWIFLLAFPLSLKAQYFESSPYSGVGSPFFKLVAHRQFSDSTGMNDVHIVAEFLNDDLTFIKNEAKGYEAEVELLVAIYQEERENIFSKTIRKKIYVKHFEQTNDRDDKAILQTKIEVPDNEYHLLARATDLNSSKTIQRKIKLDLKPYHNEPLALSDILFLENYERDSQMALKNFELNMSNNFISKDGDFYVYTDIYVKKIPTKVVFRYKFESSDEQVEIDSSVTVKIEQNISSNLFVMNKKRFDRNKYLLKVFATSGSYTTQKEQQISFFWTDSPISSDDIEAALMQMTYIANTDSIDEALDLPAGEQKKYFERFWAGRDPNPSTQINELKNEYFRRINYCNNHFSAMGIKGWKTDRGRILIKFGYPDDVDRHPFDLDSKPYVVWYYHSLRKKFLFIDRTGFGDYYLHPNYSHVEFE